MTIKNGKIVQLTYSLKNPEGQLLDQADRAAPFAYLHGGGQIVPGLEKGLEGLKAGDKKQVVVSPEEGYGETNPSLKLSVNRTQFPKDVEIEVGMQFEAPSQDGEGIVFTVESVDAEKVHIDGNHPLAGVTLHFAVEVIEVRDATAEELEHGHAHGPDGHHHH